MKLIIPGKPIPKARARHARRGKFNITYDPQEKEKKLVKQIMTAQLIEAYDVSEKAVTQELYKICNSNVFSVKFLFFLPLNQSDSVITRNRKLWGITKADTKPDYDNLEKFYLDCANGILWNDDASVVLASAAKLYSEEPRVEIEVTVLDNIILSEKEEKILTLFSPDEVQELQIYADKITKIPNPELESIVNGHIFSWMVSTASLLSEFSLKYSAKLNKIAKLGEINEQDWKSKSDIKAIKL